MTYPERKDEVIKFIREHMVEQGISDSEARMSAVNVHFFSSKDVDNLFKCLHSGLEDHIIESIVAHDFNGLAAKDEGFLPKSSQFENNKLEG